MQELSGFWETVMNILLGPGGLSYPPPTPPTEPTPPTPPTPPSGRETPEWVKLAVIGGGAGILFALLLKAGK